MSWHWIDTQRAFDSAMDALAGSPVLALDTEFYRRASFFSAPCLLQIANEKDTYLIDLLAELRLTKLGAILANEQVVKIFHAAGEDVELLYRVTQVHPASVFDTQIAAAFLGMGRQLGYAALVQQVFPDVVLDKSHSTFDWRTRPLPESCARYAALDVAFLLAIHAQTHDGLMENGRLAWVQEECDTLVENTIDAITQSASGQYLHFHHCAFMTIEQQHALNLLLTWREERARHTNSVRKSILSEEQVIDIAMLYGNCSNKSALFGVLLDTQKTQHGTALWSLWCELHDSYMTSCIPILAKKSHASLLQKLSKRRGAIAEQMALEPCLLAIHKQMTNLIYYQYYQDSELQDQLCHPNLLKGWRRDVVGMELAELCPVNAAYSM